MRKVILIALAAALLAAGTGCDTSSTNEGDGKPEITGLIFAVEDDRILVVSGIEDADISYDEWFENGRRAIYFTVGPDTEIKKGEENFPANQLVKGLKVQVWATGPIMESYPEQGMAKKIIIL